MARVTPETLIQRCGKLCRGEGAVLGAGGLDDVVGRRGLDALNPRQIEIYCPIIVAVHLKLGG